METVGAELIRLLKLHRATLSRKLADIGLFTGQDALIYHLSLSEGQTMSDLAEKLQIQQATLFIMVERMVKEDLLVKEKDKNDKRTSRIYLRPKGKKMLSELSRIWHETEAEITKGFTKEERSEAIMILRKIANNLKHKKNENE